MSIPLSGKTRPFGKIGFGPISWHFSGSERKEGSQTFVWLLIVAAIVGLLMVSGITGLSGHKREDGKRLEQIKKQNGRRHMSSMSNHSLDRPAAR
jgi:hypothetical protein